MTPERYRRVSELFADVVDMPTTERDEALSAACADDEELRREVEELLAADAEPAKGLGAVSEVLGRILAEGSIDAPETTDIEVGDVLDQRYRIERIIGEGGMGVVAEATHLGLNERVAIKLLRSDVFASPTRVERFLREARAAAQLKSAHIVRVRDVGAIDGTPYMAMDLLSGSDLAHVLATHGPLPVGEAVLLVLQACEALAVAHRAGIVHRDIKPANLFVEQTSTGPRLTLLDFGISKTSDERQSDLTHSDDIVGSPAYMSPEQLRSAKDVDERTDIWSLGVVLYELIHGRRPFLAKTRADLFLAVLQEPTPRTMDAPPTIARAIAQCLEKDPNNRPPNVAVLASVLGREMGVAGHAAAARVAAARGVAIVRAPEPTSPRRHWIAGGGLLIAAALGYALWTSAFSEDSSVVAQEERADSNTTEIESLDPEIVPEQETTSTEEVEAIEVPTSTPTSVPTADVSASPVDPPPPSAPPTPSEPDPYDSRN